MNNACNNPIDHLMNRRIDAIRDKTDVQRMIRDMREAMTNRSKKEISFMEGKNQRLVTAVNQMVYDNQQDIRRLEKLRAVLKKDGLCAVKQNDAQSRFEVDCRI